MSELRQTVRETINIPKELKIKLLIYAVISAISFSYLVMADRAGISLFIFTLLQFVLMWFFAPNKKRLILFVPLLLVALSGFLSASTVWRIPNFVVSTILYSCMFMDMSFKKDTTDHFSEAFERILQPIAYFLLPFRWILEINSEKAPVIKRVMLALVIAIPSALFLTIILANADMVFSMRAENVFYKLFDLVSIRTLIRVFWGIIAGLYLFGCLYFSHIQKKCTSDISFQKKGDIIIIDILLGTILFVYTAFVIIQFKYLFAGATLPEGLFYAEYARKGFFELLFLTGVNLAIILSVTKFTKAYSGRQLLFVKILCNYLCAVTVVLLVSSFYRMMLYVDAHGLTRLRLYVLGFLIFEAAGLLLTFAYIAKPKFNITLIYIVISLAYYCTLNLVPTDNIIAKNQVDLYLSGTGRGSGINYVFSLSPDAAPSLEYLYENTDNETIRKDVLNRLEYQSVVPDCWQQTNYSHSRLKKIYNKLK